MKDKTEILKHYLIAALWVAELDALDIKNVHLESLKKAVKDINSFVKKAGSLLDGISEEMIGHDFLLTRNGHGAGFWDRGLGEVGKKLTDIAHDLKSVDISEEGGVIFIE